MKVHLLRLLRVLIGLLLLSLLVLGSCNSREEQPSGNGRTSWSPCRDASAESSEGSDASTAPVVVPDPLTQRTSPPGSAVRDEPASSCPEGRGGESEAAFWVIGDDRDNLPIMKENVQAVARRMRCVSARRSFLLHGGDLFTRRWYAADRPSLAEVVQAYRPLLGIPGVQLLFSPGNHEGVSGSRELAERLGLEPAEDLHQAVVAGPLQLITLNTEDRELVRKGSGEQAVWLKEQLRQARVQGRLPVLLMHRPPARLSCGHHRSDADLAAWERVLSGLLDDGPGLVLAAHDHLYLRVALNETWHGVLVGHGGAPLSLRQPCPAALVQIAPTAHERRDLAAGKEDPRRFHGFLECRLQPAELRCQAFDLMRESRDSFSLPLPAPLAAGGASR